MRTRRIVGSVRCVYETGVEVAIGVEWIGVIIKYRDVSYTSAGTFERKKINRSICRYIERAISSGVAWSEKHVVSTRIFGRCI